MKKAITKCVMDMESLLWLPELEESSEYAGKWEYALGGASHGDNDVNSEQHQFFNELTQNTTTAFQGAQTDLDALNKAWGAISSQGINQYGYSSAEDRAITGAITNAGAQATENTVSAEQLNQQQAAGGANAGPSGASEALQTQAREVGAQNTATELGQEKIAGFETGRENYLAATQGEQEVAGTEAGLANSQASAAVGQGGNEIKAQQMVDTANQNSLLNKVLGGVVSGGLSLATNALSNVFNGPGSNPGSGPGGQGPNPAPAAAANVLQQPVPTYIPQ